MENKLAVSEHFLSIQGEGQTMGKLSYFLRLAACNLMCGGKGTEKDGKLHDGATWRCDSIEVWMKGKNMSFDEIIEAMGGQRFIFDLKEGAHLIITGGEPLLQQDNILRFLQHIYYKYLMDWPVVEIETNGTIVPNYQLSAGVKYWNVSPKLQNSGMPEGKRIVPEALRHFKELERHTIFKFVISGESDWSEIIATYMPHIKRSQIWLMPAADTRGQLVNKSIQVAEIAIREKLNFSSRIHLNIWDQRTGV